MGAPRAHAAGLAVLAAVLTLSGCAGRTAAPPVDPVAVRRVVGDVMSAQVRIGPEEKLGALADLEDFLTRTDLRTERVAQALTELADMYLSIELNTWRRRARLVGGTVAADHERSIRLYRKVLADYPVRHANHAVYYQLARAYADLGETTSEVAALQGLVNRAPHGPYLAEALYRLGEAAFDQGRFEVAASRYEAALGEEDADPRLQDFAAYKRTWSYYLMPDFAAGEAAAVDFVDLHRVPRGGGVVLDSRALPEPDWERVREVVLVLARMLDATGGVTALESVAAGRDYLPMLYHNLGEVAAQLGRPKDAIATYEAYLQRYPTAPDVPDFFKSMVDVYNDERDLNAAVRVRERLVRECGPGSRWWEAQTPSVQLAMGSQVRQTAQRLARHHHSEAQEAKTPAAYARAIAAYRDFLARYGDSPEAPETWFLLGETLFESEDYTGAAEAYAASAYDYPVHRRAAEAAYAAVYAREHALADTDPEDAAYDPRLTALVDAFGKMVEAFPREPRLEAAYGRITGLLFDRNDYARLYEVSDRVIRLGPRSRTLHAAAWRALGEAALGLERYDQAETALAQALEYVADDPKEGGEIRKLLAAASAARATGPGVTDLEAGERLLEAAARLGADDPLGRSARVDAGIAFLKGGDEARAMDTFEAFLKDFPKDPQRDRVARAVLGMGEAALEAGDPAAADAALDRYLAWFAGEWPERDRVVAQSRARTHLAAGDLDAADAAFTTQLKSYAPGEAPEELVDRLAGVRYKRAAQRIEAGDPAGLDILRGIADELPNSRVAPKALDYIIKAVPVVGATSAVAVDAAQVLVARHPASPEAQAAEAAYPDLLIAAGRPVEAAAALVERAGDVPPAQAPALLRRAAGLYEAEGDAAHAAQTLLHLRERSAPGSDPWVAVTVDVARLLEAGTTQVPERTQAPDLHARIDQRLLDTLEPLDQAETLGPAGRRLAAEVWLARADAARARFDGVRLVPPLDRNLKAKQEALKEALADYREAAAYRSLEATPQATRGMGELLEAFARAMLEAPVPAELTEAQVGIYRAALKKRAAPYLAQAVEAHERNLARAREGVAGPDVDASLAALGRLRPEWYDRPEIDVRPIHVP